jgi:hypothetical protein
MVYSNTKQVFESTADLGTLVEAYCETCTRKIEAAHERHDEDVESFRRELDDLPTYRRDA